MHRLLAVRKNLSLGGNYDGTPARYPLSFGSGATGKTGMTVPSSDPAGKSEPVKSPAPAAEAPGAASAATAEITLQDFQRIQLRVGVIKSADIHPQADRLLVLQVDLGEPQLRQVVAGIRANYQPADLVGKQVVVVANLKAALLRGVESKGMVLAGSDAASGIVILSPERPLTPGSPVK